MSNTPTTQNSANWQFDEPTSQARQLVAQSAAIAVQDAVATLRNLNSMSATAIGVSLAQYIQTGDYKFITAISNANTVAKNAAQNFGDVGQKAGDILANFPGMTDTGRG